MYKKLVSLALVATFSLPTLADEASVKKAVEAKLGAAVTSVTRTPYLGLYEVYANLHRREGFGAARRLADRWQDDEKRNG